MDRQTLRDWVVRYNAEGLAGLSDRAPPGPAFRLTPEQMAELSEIAEAGPDPAVDHVVRWRCVDLRRVIAARWGVTFHERTVGKLLHRLGFARMPFLIGSRETKLRSFVAPGAVLSVTATLVHEGSGFAVTNAAITAGGKRICEVRELKFSLQEFPAPELQAAMHGRAVQIGLIEEPPA